MRFMADVSIVGAAVYAGQETLDRVLGHPQLRPRRGRLRLARGPGGERARPAACRGAAVPSFVTNEEALAHEADVTIVCLSHEAAAAIDVPSAGVVVDLSGAHRLRDASGYEGVVQLTRTRIPRGSANGSTACRSSSPRRAGSFATPAVTQPRRCSRWRRFAHAIDPGSSRCRRPVGDDGRGPDAEGLLWRGRGARERLPLPGGQAPGAGVPEIAQLLGFPVSFTPHLLPVRRGLITTCNVRSTGPDLRALLEAAYAGSAVVTVLPEGMAPELAQGAAHRPGRDRCLRGQLHRPDDSDLRRGQPR